MSQGYCIFTDDRQHRYVLRRTWENKEHLCFIGLNPSVANEVQNDNTVRRVIRYAKDWGFGGLTVLNLFGLVSTDPKGLKSIENPAGAENDYYIRNTMKKHSTIFCGWGNHGKDRNRDSEVIKIITEAGRVPKCLAVNKTGTPKHPLYLKKDLKLRNYELSKV